MMGLSCLYNFFSYMCFVVCLHSNHLAVANSNSTMLQPLCHDDERSALLQFKQSLVINKSASIDPSAYPKVESWNLEEDNMDCCLWDGVRCDVKTGHVIKLDLTSSCLYGSINSATSLFSLVHLRWLSLGDNNFRQSKIPSRIMNLSGLIHLNLSQSGISGQIPSEMLELFRLKTLILSHNYLLRLQKPGLSSFFEKLTNLKVIDLSHVNISSPLPQILTNFSSLVYLSLQECGLQGEFPTQIFRLPILDFLDVRSNRDLTGYLSEFESSRLTFLDISDCNFSGTIPSSIGNLTILVHLSISFNNFYGELPFSIGNLGSLKELFIRGCSISGQIPSSLANLTQLGFLDLSYNKFSSQNSSSLSWIAKLTKLTYLDLSYLNLSGEIPLFKNLTQLTNLIMIQNKLTGPMPCSFMNLTKLTYLFLTQNLLTGPIPCELMNLTQLIELDMSDNKLTGPIPSCLTNINQLSTLYLRSNHLTGHIPLEIRNLTQLGALDLSSNSLQGRIPSTIFELKNLQYLWLQSNNLSGRVELDMFFGQLKSLEVLILSSNNLSVPSKTTLDPNAKFKAIGLRSCNLTEFPNFLHNQDQLCGLDISSNRISGHIPSWFLSLGKDHLVSLNLSHNHLIGFDKQPLVLPWTNLLTLDLSFNKLQGPLPIPSVSTIHYLASNNNLTGGISPQICNLNHLYALDLSNNNLSSTIPQCFGNFSINLSILELQSNEFHGSIPQTFTTGTSLRMIDLSHKKLQGKISRSIINCTKLEFLHLGNNQISDTFPSWLGALPELRVLILKSNKFHGVIEEPKTNFEFPKLRIIDLSHNTFRGMLPSRYFQCWNGMKVVNEGRLTYMQEELLPSSPPTFAYYEFIEYVYSLTIHNKGIELKYEKISNMLTSIILSRNKFVGEIPTTIASLKSLNNLNLSQNNLSGQIPLLLGNLTALESLVLSNNELSGEIPSQLVEITSLEVFDVSHNHLIGQIPQGKQFDTFENSSYDGNIGLCGKPLSKKCENLGPSRKEEDPGSESPFVLDWKMVLIGYGSGLIIGVILGHAVCTRKYHWFVKIFRIQKIKRKRGSRN